ncbi:MAG: extracellular solute-binding protein [Butyrivibrio sp.]|nr:extracellular solute-binding protein [Butyrivibrio sp.]
MRLRLRYRLLSILLVLAGTCLTLFYADAGVQVQDEVLLFEQEKKTLRLWYTDPALTDYLTGRAVEYNRGSRTVRVEPTLVAGIEFLEEVSRASVEGDNYPDLYILSHDSLGKAYLAGLATTIDDVGYLTDDESGFGMAARNAVRYHDNYVAYPFYFETSSLLYNRSYLEAEARLELEREADQAAGEAAQAAVDEAEEESAEADTEEGGEGGVGDEGMPELSIGETGEIELSPAEVDARVASFLPSTIADILTFADKYNAPEAVEAVFKWDVTDLFYNYFFVGGYMSLGGAAGDDPAQIDIYNESTLDCMNVYQQLNQFFAIDADDVSYDEVMEDFIEGKIVFTLATTDAIARLERAREEGRCDFDYGVAPMPGLTPGYHTRTMSVTEALVINGYSENAAEANAFARFLAGEQTDSLYRMAGKLLAHQGVSYANEGITSFLYVYENSVPLTKLLELSNFWVQLEIAFEEIWDGADVNQTMRTLTEAALRQVTGEEYHQKPLPDPQILFTYSTEEDDGGN